LATTIPKEMLIKL